MFVVLLACFKHYVKRDGKVGHKMEVQLIEVIII